MQKDPAVPSRRPKPFLTAEWQSLVMINYEIDPAVLQPYLPRGVELDAWNGQTFASLVGFLFLNTRVLGVAVPYHRNFEEVNLRFYVRRKGPEGWRRGVVFIKEIVPRRAIAAVARWFYGEIFVAMRMKHKIDRDGGKNLQTGSTIEYAWLAKGYWNRLGVCIQGEPLMAAPGSEEEFITEHYWGYASQRGGRSVEYQVEHPSWMVWQVSESYFSCDVSALYGPQFHESLSGKPSSAFLAEGSPVTVYRGRHLSRPTP